MESTDLSASFYDTKTTARRFGTIFKILWPLSLAQCALKVEKPEIHCSDFLIAKVRVT